MSDLARSVLEQRERRLSAELIRSISDWLDREREIGKFPLPHELFSRYVPQIAGEALEKRSRDLLRLVVKGDLRSAAWVHDPRRETDSVSLTLPFWIGQQIGIDPHPFIWEVSTEFGAEIAQLVEAEFPVIENALADNGGPLRRIRQVPVRLVGGRIDFEPCWDFDDYQEMVDYVTWTIENLPVEVERVRKLEGRAAAARMANERTRPDLGRMDWFGGSPAPEGMAIWDDVDPLADVRADLDRLVVTGAAAAPPSAELVRAYVREKATVVARHGSDESLRQGLAAALFGAEPLLALLGHAVWFFEGVTGADRVDRALRQLPSGLLGGRALSGQSLVGDVVPDGVVLTGPSGGLRYSDPFL
jgi:hypothetical protein